MCGGGCRVEGKGVEPKEPKGHQLVVEVVASREQRISRIKMAKKEIKLAWAQKMASKEALVVKLLVNQKASCKSEDTCSHAVVLRLIAVKSRVQQGQERGR